MKGLRRILLAGLTGLCCGTAALADGWGQFYVSSQRPTGSTRGAPIAAGSEDGICIKEILAAQARYGIPDNMLLAIGLQEAGTRRNGRFTVWPYAVNAEGEGRLFDSRAAALDWIAEQTARRRAVHRRGLHADQHALASRRIHERGPGLRSGGERRLRRALPDATVSSDRQLDGRCGVLPFAGTAVPRHLPALGSHSNIAAANARLPEFIALAARSLPPRRAVPRDAMTARNIVVARATWGASLGGASNATHVALFDADDTADPADLYILAVRARRMSGKSTILPQLGIFRGNKDVGFAIGMALVLSILFLPLPPVLLDLALPCRCRSAC